MLFPLIHAQAGMSGGEVSARHKQTVVPAKAGTQLLLLKSSYERKRWIPAFAGMTGSIAERADAHDSGGSGAAS